MCDDGMIEWVARDAEKHNAPGLYRNMLEDALVPALYARGAHSTRG